MNAIGNGALGSLGLRGNQVRRHPIGRVKHPGWGSELSWEKEPPHLLRQEATKLAHVWIWWEEVVPGPQLSRPTRPSQRELSRPAWRSQRDTPGDLNPSPFLLLPRAWPLCIHIYEPMGILVQTTMVCFRGTILL